MFVVTSVVVLANSYHQDQVLGSDDSTLNATDYRATWILMLISGIFCTLGEVLICLELT